MTFRKIFFWIHLTSGLVAGLTIALLALTGLALSFEPQIVDWFERDVRRIPAAAEGAERASIEDLMKYIREEHPDARPSGFTIYADPRVAITIPAGRGLTFHADPYTTEVREAGSAKLRGFFNFTLSLHRYLTLSGDQRPIGKQIIGVSTIVFFALTLTGLVIWWPRKWNWRAMKPSVAFIKARGKLRDWNWHNVFGLWSAPVLIVICVTGLMMSYRWAGNLSYVLTGNPVPAAPARGANAPAPVPAPETAPSAPSQSGDTTAEAQPREETNTALVIPAPPPGTRPLRYAPLLEKVAAAHPNWTAITLRPEGGGRRAPNRGNVPADNTAMASTNTPPAETTPPAERPRRAERGPRTPGPVTFTVRTSDMVLSNSLLTLSLNPYTGEILRTESNADQNWGRRIRALARPIHTGVALGWPTQLVAALGCVAALFLTYTGFALSWRRFFGKNRKKPQAT